MQQDKNTQQAESATKREQAFAARTPEQQKAVDDFHRQIGQSLVDNLNRNVLAASTPPKDALPKP
jgi:hypothetical protein